MECESVVRWCNPAIVSERDPKIRSILMVYGSYDTPFCRIVFIVALCRCWTRGVVIAYAHIRVGRDWAIRGTMLERIIVKLTHFSYFQLAVPEEWSRRGMGRMIGSRLGLKAGGLADGAVV